MFITGMRKFGLRNFLLCFSFPTKDQSQHPFIGKEKSKVKCKLLDGGPRLNKGKLK